MDVVILFFLLLKLQSLINNFNLTGRLRKEWRYGNEWSGWDLFKTGESREKDLFFDVKATRNNDYYLTITESKKKLEKDGSQNYEKHKIFLYKEDFDKFAEGLDNAVAYIKAALNGETMAVQEEVETNKFDDIDFDDLSK